MNLVLGDAAFWIARRDRRDQNHLHALRVAQDLVRARSQIVVTPLIFAEVHACFSRARLAREQIIRDCWQNPIVRIEQTTFDDQQRAVEILLTHKDKSFSFCDAVSFVVMERLHIRGVATFDDHFLQFGKFEILNGGEPHPL